VLTELLCQIDSLDEAMARFDTRNQGRSPPFEAAISLLETMPGVARRTAEMIVAEIGTDMTLSRCGPCGLVGWRRPQQP
jgi:transposase